MVRSNGQNNDYHNFGGYRHVAVVLVEDSDEAKQMSNRKFTNATHKITRQVNSLWGI